MSKFWVKIDEAVEGPFHANTIKFIEGFTPDSLVSPDDPNLPEAWSKAGEVEEIKRFLHPIPAEKPALKIEPEPSNLQTIEELWEETLIKEEKTQELPALKPEVLDVPESVSNLDLL